MLPTLISTDSAAAGDNQILLFTLFFFFFGKERFPETLELNGVMTRSMD